VTLLGGTEHQRLIDAGHMLACIGFEFMLRGGLTSEVAVLRLQPVEVSSGAAERSSQGT
jgi:hypothetical protein